MTDERWRPVVGYEGIYEVSDQGRVRSLDRFFMRRHGEGYRLRGRVLSPVYQKGYPTVKLSRSGSVKGRPIHILVAEAFIGPRPVEYVQVRHLNDIKTDNRPSNLAYGTRSDNAQDSLRNGTHANAEKMYCPYGHALAEPNLTSPPRRGVQKRRGCLSCARTRAYIQRHPETRPHHQTISDQYYAAIIAEKASAA